jgi:hypothetical protein
LGTNEQIWSSGRAENALKYKYLVV